MSCAHELMFTADEVALQKGFLRVLRFFPMLNHHAIVLHNLSPPHQACICSDQAARYHTFGRKLGASPLVRYFAGFEVKVVLFTLLYTVKRIQRSKKAIP
jgi:hypothetical protein